MSELYASVLMIGVTLSFGSVVTGLAVAQLQASTNGDSQAAFAQQSSVGEQVALVYGTLAQGSGGCTSTYVGADGGTYTEGKSYTLTLFDYGSVPFELSEVFDNGTLLAAGGYTPIGPSPVANAISLVSCGHPWGQTFLLVDGSGGEVTVET